MDTSPFFNFNYLQVSKTFKTNWKAPDRASPVTLQTVSASEKPGNVVDGIKLQDAKIRTRNKQVAEAGRSSAWRATRRSWSGQDRMVSNVAGLWVASQNCTSCQLARSYTKRHFKLSYDGIGQDLMENQANAGKHWNCWCRLMVPEEGKSRTTRCLYSHVDHINYD